MRKSAAAPSREQTAVDVYKRQTLGLNGDGVGLNYHYGLFKQVFENNLQKETKNPWIQDESWLTKTDKSYQVQFGGFNVTSKLYDIDVTGYEKMCIRDSHYAG